MPWFTEEFQLPADGWRPEFRAAMDLASPLERGAGSSSSMHELPLQAASAAR
jgi:hypothetical protein